MGGGVNLSVGPDRVWPQKIYAGKRGAGIARNGRYAVFWHVF